MTVYCIIPVHNRVSETLGVLRCLRAQDYAHIQTVVVDDGSTDGTADLVRQNFPEVELLSGNGNLWWSGAMARGLKFVLPRAKEDDYVLFQNNDTSFAPDYVRTLVSVSEIHSGAVVGSILRDSSDPERTISVGPKVSYLKTRIEELHSTSEKRCEIVSPGAGLPEVIELEALSGRGTLYPVEVFRRVGIVRQRWLPHYMSDYEMAARAKAAGFRTLVSTRAVVWTSPENSGIDPKTSSFFQRLAGRKSRSNIFDTVAFFALCGPWHLRATAPIRVVLLRAWGALRRKLAESRP